MPSCTAENAAGEPCGFPALKDSDQCWNHSPDARREAQEARRKGGRTRANPHSGPPPEVDVSSVEGIAKLLAYTVSELLAAPNSVMRNRALLQAVERAGTLYQLSDDVDALRAFMEDYQRKEGRRR